MPPKTYLKYSQHNGDLRTMPAYLVRLNLSTVKIVNSHTDNPKKYGLPTVMATILLIDPQNGQLKAILGGTYITALRTGAAGGLAARFLAKKESKTVGFIGAGVQARTQLLALQSVFPDLAKAKVWDLFPRAAEAFTAEINAKGNLHAIAAASAKDAVVDCDIVLTTTPSVTPIVMDSWVSGGVHFNCIGADAPGKEELEPAILKRATIVVDDWVQAAHSGEINVPITKGVLSKVDIWAELSEVVAGTKAGRESPNEVTVFDSTGLAIQDTVTAALAYREAIQRKVGQYITI
jgi:alanine dehydrogenase